MITYIVLIFVGAILGILITAVLTASRESDLRAELVLRDKLLTAIASAVIRWHGMVNDPNCREYTRRCLEREMLEKIYGLLCRAGSEEGKP